MKIFLAFLQSPVRYAIPAYSFWEHYIKRGIEESGHCWVESKIDWARGIVPCDKAALESWRTEAWSKTLDSLKNEFRDVTLFLSYLYPQQVDQSAIAEIRRLGVPCVNFFCDNVRDFHKIPPEFSCFDLHWVPEFEALKQYEKVGFPHLYSPMPVWIPPALRTSEHEDRYGVSFIGSPDAQRKALLGSALQAGVTLEIYGNSWFGSKEHTPRSKRTVLNQLPYLRKHGLRAWTRKLGVRSQWEPPNEVFTHAVRATLTDSEYIPVMQQSTICLGINRYASFAHPFATPNAFSRLRDLEAPMAGACYLTEMVAGLSDLYDLGEDIEVYSNAEELVEKIAELKGDVTKRKQLRRQGQRRALSSHTIPQTLERISIRLGAA